MTLDQSRVEEYGQFRSTIARFNKTIAKAEKILANLTSLHANRIVERV